MQERSRKLLDWVRDAIRLKHDAYAPEQIYVQWIRRYILHNKRQPKEMGNAEFDGSSSPNDRKWVL